MLKISDLPKFVCQDCYQLHLEEIATKPSLMEFLLRVLQSNKDLAMFYIVSKEKCACASNQIVMETDMEETRGN